MIKLKRTEGDFLQINLGDGTHTYCLIAEDPLVIFFKIKTKIKLTPNQILQNDELFRLWVYKRDLINGKWKKVGHLPLNKEHMGQPLFFKQDPISGKLSLHHKKFIHSNYEKPATILDCEGLERAAVWSGAHIESRVRDYFSGKPNIWVEQLKINTKTVPEDQQS